MYVVFIANFLLFLQCTPRSSNTPTVMLIPALTTTDPNTDHTIIKQNL